MAQFNPHNQLHLRFIKSYIKILSAMFGLENVCGEDSKLIEILGGIKVEPVSIFKKIDLEDESGES